MTDRRIGQYEIIGLIARLVATSQNVKRSLIVKYLSKCVKPRPITEPETYFVKRLQSQGDFPYVDANFRFCEVFSLVEMGEHFTSIYKI